MLYPLWVILVRSKGIVRGAREAFDTETQTNAHSFTLYILVGRVPLIKIIIDIFAHVYGFPIHKSHWCVFPRVNFSNA